MIVRYCTLTPSSSIVNAAICYWGNSWTKYWTITKKNTSF